MPPFACEMHQDRSKLHRKVYMHVGHRQKRGLASLALACTLRAKELVSECNFTVYTHKADTAVAGLRLTCCDFEPAMRQIRASLTLASFAACCPPGAHIAFEMGACRRILFWRYPSDRPFVLLDMSSAFDLITWMSLISLPCGSTLYNNVILFGKAWIFVQGLVLVKALGVAHMPDGLQGLHTNMLGLYWIFLSLPHV